MKAYIFVFICLCLGTALADSPAAEARPAVKTDVVGQAMALVRQQKFEEARVLLLAAAEKGEAEPQALLGQMYNAGWGVPVDYEQAFQWWSRAAEGGSTDAQWGLGLLYDDGKGVIRDSKKAADLWSRAARRGNIKATLSLAYLYRDGRGDEFEQDLIECTRLFGIAAEAGEPIAQFNYGLRIHSGEGVPADPILGCAWIAVAAGSPRVQGTSYAGKMSAKRDKVWTELSSEDRAKAEILEKKIQSRFQVD